MLRLIIGNKNYSSWSMRPWLVLQQAGIPFHEDKVSFASPDWRAYVRKVAPLGQVPVLVDGDLVIWDSLAIVEYLAERFPAKHLWPQDTRARAHARAICAEMHSSFQNLRGVLPMNATARFTRPLLPLPAQRDIARVLDIWTDCRSRYGGPYLFGSFSIADAFYAPVTRRFVTYDVKLNAVGDEYVRTIETTPAVQSYLKAAAEENEFVDWDEPYRQAPT